MYCEHCKVEIEGAARNCPLCHEPLDSYEQMFPKVKSTKRLQKATFRLIYLCCALVVETLCILFNIFFPSKIMWSLAVLGLLIYVYVLVANTIKSKRHTASKIFFQIIAVSVLAILLQTLTPNVIWALNYAVPIILLVGGVVLGIISLASKKAGTYIFCLLIITILGLVPILYTLILKEPVLWPSIACAAGCGIMLLVIIGFEIFGRKKFIGGELKRKLHI